MAPTAPNAVLCGDPARALLIAQAVLVEPRMSNHHRGLWGYWGQTPAGMDLTVQATGIGGPSATLVLGELADAGLEAAIRVGSCAAAEDAPLPLGATIVAAGLDPELTRGLVERDAGTVGAVVSADTAPYRAAGATRDPTSDSPVLGRDMQTAALAAAAAERSIKLAATLVVVDAAGKALEDDALDDRSERLGLIAAEALTAVATDVGSTSS